ncbi:hypothetical protein GGH91_001098 [Coemansia sp. RSA 2671]|nr:hypothetical protein LPJ60_000289 [Coemansia sp. RSA 2675]KAJ2016904.1 hypothetical protein IWW57_005452 [Coemansia sp. S610]KAJ2348963.1 hypothetical protein GGH91_001098 [Coemansia sp. RSA 2671]KAJ2367170.1 hypothetical protein H4S02_010334 [Coemansia sp. RSA 2611]KAJ2415517.1 hypothetical protein GGI10_001636 [Coemansia sp. RSA 2530]KAJ2700412.1 hypothetical protein H4218_002045 [Coemansia sp. IMI 209128]
MEDSTVDDGTFEHLSVEETPRLSRSGSLQLDSTNSLGNLSGELAQAAEPESADESNSTQLRQRRRVVGTVEDATDDEAVLAHSTAREFSSKGKEPASSSKQEASAKDGRAEDKLAARSVDGGDEFSCNICFDTATDPVLTICGHLFCWSCLVQWLERSATCPVCKAGCDKDKVIPVYGRGREEKDPRHNPNLPNRPAGQRPPPPVRQHNQLFGFDPFGVPGSFHGMGRVGGAGGAVFVGGLGLLPALMGFTTFSTGHIGNLPMGSNGVGSSPQPVSQQAFGSRVLMMLAAMILMSILFY